MHLLKLYKVSSFFYEKNFKKISNILDFANKRINKSIVYGATKIGEGTVFAYGGISVVVHKKAIIGKNCMVGQCVTIGRTHGKNSGVPIIEDNVYIGAGAKIIGGITIGNNSIIAPNSVVTKSVEPCSVIAGIPGKLINRITKENFEEKYIPYGIEKFIDEDF